VRELATFASSEAGKTFVRIEQHFGRDPAAYLEDDVLAHNLRAAFILTLSHEEAEPMDDPVERARQGGDKIRRAMNG
jgi:N-acyl-D-aspartate/D-glutamate deacylase